jgi:hypothetical protein
MRTRTNVRRRSRPALRSPGAARTAVHVSVLTLLAATLAACGSLTSDTPAAVTWSSADVGAVGIPGATVLGATGTPVTVHGSGQDVWGTEDGFHFSYVEVSGSGSLTVRIDGMVGPHDWSKAGVMFREDVGADARNVFLLTTPAQGVVLQARSQRGGITSDTPPGGATMHDPAPRPPTWLRLERRGDTFVGSHSVDGASWVEVGGIQLALPDTVLVGVAVTSHDNARTATGHVGAMELDAQVKGAPPPAATGERVTYRPDHSDFPNPERGWYVEPGNNDYAAAAARGNTLAMRYVRLDEFRYQALSAGFLNDLRADLASARGSGVKLVLRFAYNRSMSDDAPLDVVVQHVEQLAPVLAEFADVIAVVQAGFIGAWGEWHSSTNGLTSSENRERILTALLDAVATSRMVQLRYPYHAREFLPVPPSDAQAFDGSEASRVGLMNDCFLANSSDGGTYRDQLDRDYSASLSRVTAVGGETCNIGGLSERNSCEMALAELDQYNWDYLNEEFYRGILDRWKAEGCYDEISRRLGYRFVLISGAVDERVSPGDALTVSLSVANEGFGKLYNARPVDVVLLPRTGGAPLVLRALHDARAVMPLSGQTRDVHLSVTVPAGAPTGAYDVALRLPDPSPHLESDPRYSLRFANEGVWQASSGYNRLLIAVSVAGS